MKDSIKNIIIEGFEPLEELASFSKHVAEEGIVLLKNNQKVNWYHFLVLYVLCSYFIIFVDS
jgi:hypothetical protein